MQFRSLILTCCPFACVTEWVDLFLLVPSISITNVQAYPYNATALMVTWDPVPDTREVMKGKLLGYQVKNEPSWIAL